ncbi:MAG: hypothetical protein HC897_14235, partial [Thermoanaerobaculia bacterium]|nr:hypothetical protein [Thermoanaerobaculia bacterium]
MRGFASSTFLLLRSVALAALALLATAAQSQQHPNVARGFSAEKLYSFLGIDQISPFNGTLSITIPIGNTYPAGGDLSYGLTLVYSANGWNWQVQCAGTACYSLPRANPDSNAGFSWMLELGKLIAPNTLPRNPTAYWLYVAPDGAEHLLYPALHVGDPVTANVFYSRSGSYLRLRKVGANWELDAGDTIHSFTATGQLTQIRDRFGNFLAINRADPNQWVLSDNHGRTHRIYLSNKSYDGTTVKMIDKVQLATFGGNTADYDFTYTQVSITRPCPFLLGNNPFLPDTASVPLLTKLTLPDASSYDVASTDYEQSRATGCQNPGVLRKVRLPTLGYIAWDYGLYTFPTGSVRPGDYPPGGFPAFFTQKPGVTQRRLLNPNGGEIGRWLYEQNLVIPQPIGSQEPVEMTNTITDPNNHKRVLYFSAYRTGPNSVKDVNPRHYGLPITPRTNDGTPTKRFLSEEVFDSAGNKLRSIYRRYEHDEPTNPNDLSELAFNPRMVTERTVYHDDGDRYREVTYSAFDGLGHYRQSTTGGNFGRANVRSAFTNFNPAQGTYQFDPVSGLPTAAHSFTMLASTAPWVLDTFTETSQSEGTTALRETCFEASTGFLLRERKLASGDGTRQNKDVLTVFTRDTAGNLSREQFYGGDTQALSVGANLCSLALPTNDQYRIDHEYQYGVRRRSRYADAAGTALTFYTLDLDIDQNTGLPVASRDTAGLQTDYAYDGLGRLTWEMPAAGHDAWIEYVYNRATSAAALAKVRILGRVNGSQAGAGDTRHEVYYDGVGRVWRERRFQATFGWVARDTTRDGLGQPTQVSEWEATPTHWTEYLGRDPFGRPTTIRPPDGSAHDVSFSYNGERLMSRTVKIGTSRATNGTINETPATTTEEYDGQGRLWKVTEPAGGQTADYRYDVGQRLSEVRLTQGVNQYRYFTYDNRGFMTSEQHPETGVITYSRFDARGHAGRM